MAIGMTPLIPLDRVVPVPDPWLQRFGVNNSQLFGKPMVNFTSGSLSASPAETYGATSGAGSALQAAAGSGSVLDTGAALGAGAALGTGAANPAVSPAPALASGYSRWTGGGSGTSPAPAAGSLVDLKA